MEITRIRKDEFPSRDPSNQPPGVLSQAIHDLPIGEGLKTPCIWKHQPGKPCPGIISARNWARKHPYKINTTCRDGTLYVVKREELL